MEKPDKLKTGIFTVTKCNIYSDSFIKTQTFI